MGIVGNTITESFKDSVREHLVLQEGVQELPTDLMPNADLGIQLDGSRRIEFYFSTASDLAEAKEAFESLDTKGWELWSVVPQHCLGEAHGTLRGVVDHIQGWWRRDDGSIAFSSPEIP